MFIFATIVFLLSVVALIGGLIYPAGFKRLFGENVNRKKISALFGGTLVISAIVLGMYAPAGQKSETKSAPAQTASAPTPASLPQIHGSTTFTVNAPAQGELVINNDQGNIGKIRVVNKDNFIWKNCKVDLPADIADAMHKLNGGTPDIVGDVDPGKDFTITALTLGMKEDDFRLTDSLSITCDNGLGQVQNISQNFDKISPVMFHTNN